jgi:hypothetical protein
VIGLQRLAERFFDRDKDEIEVGRHDLVEIFNSKTKRFGKLRDLAHRVA